MRVSSRGLSQLGPPPRVPTGEGHRIRWSARIAKAVKKRVEARDPVKDAKADSRARETFKRIIMRIHTNKRKKPVTLPTFRFMEKD